VPTIIPKSFTQELKDRLSHWTARGFDLQTIKISRQHEGMNRECKPLRHDLQQLIALARFVGERLRPSMSRFPTWYQPFWHPDAQSATHQDAYDLLQTAGTGPS
jgi:hypothetical protein